MKLSTFITETLGAVIQGVREAQADPSSGRHVNPHLLSPASVIHSQGKILSSSNSLVTMLEFDVVVEADERESTKGGIRVTVGVIGLGSSGASDNGTKTVSRIKFEVPLALPTNKAPNSPSK
jgi:hypothetical protein